MHKPVAATGLKGRVRSVGVSPYPPEVGMQTLSSAASARGEGIAPKPASRKVSTENPKILYLRPVDMPWLWTCGQPDVTRQVDQNPKVVVHRVHSHWDNAKFY